jgi:hypothetical protein
MQQLPIWQTESPLPPAGPDLSAPDVPSGLGERLVSRPCPIERLTGGLPRPSGDPSGETYRFLRLVHAACQIRGGRL